MGSLPCITDAQQIPHKHVQLWQMGTYINIYINKRISMQNTNAIKPVLDKIFTIEHLLIRYALSPLEKRITSLSDVWLDEWMYVGCYQIAA